MPRTTAAPRSATSSGPTSRTRGARPHNPRAAIALIGEAEAAVQPRGLEDLERLEHIRALLAGQGHRSDAAVLALFSLHGFRPDVLDVAGRRRDVLLVDIAALYGDGPVHGLT
jgi:hypothetical protein